MSMRTSRPTSKGSDLTEISLWLTESDIHRALQPDDPPIGGDTKLVDGSKIGVIGGGPSGSLFSIFVLRSIKLAGIDVELDIFEPRHFDYAGPAGCNHCGGIISESLVQMLAAEGITLPESTVERGIDSYMLHMDAGSVRIEPPLHEKRIAAVYRGNGPKTSILVDHTGFDRFLLDMAVKLGANHRKKLVTSVDWSSGMPVLSSHDGELGRYDLLVVATGVNSLAREIIAEKELGLSSPDTVKTFIAEFHLGRENIAATLGSSMHVFLLDLPRLEFAALVPKGDYATICMLGDDIDEELINEFMNSDEVKERFKDSKVPPNVCHCFPKINVKGAKKPFADRLVFVGDAGVTRLYKDGIGAAYRTAKAAAATVAHRGFSENDFASHYWPSCKKIAIDNQIGKVVFALNGIFQSQSWTRRTILKMVTEEQKSDGVRHLSTVLWDLFTGSATYGEIMKRCLHPGLWGGFLLHIFRTKKSAQPWDDPKTITESTAERGLVHH